MKNKLKNKARIIKTSETQNVSSTDVKDPIKNWAKFHPGRRKSGGVDVSSGYVNEEEVQ